MFYSSNRKKNYSIKLIVFLILISFISSCSFFNIGRIPATVENYQSQEKILKLFSFSSSNLIDPNLDISKNINELNTLGIGKEFVMDSTLPKDVSYFLELKSDNNIFKIIIHHSKDALHDYGASGELLNFLKTINRSTFFANKFSIFEMYYNLKEQDPITANTLAKIRSEVAKVEINRFDLYDAVPPFDEAALAQNFEKRKSDWNHDLLDYIEPAKSQIKEQKKQDQVRRLAIESLDKASEDQQFKNLVAKNDRKGVADLLRKYLPWEQMAPFEKRYWETYLEVVIHPVTIDKKILIYRGIDGDFIYPAIIKGVELKKETAIKDANVFLMSTLLTKNQGTWNRRLRSLTAMNDKYIGNIDESNEFSKSARITTMFKNHSNSPNGSPFLSFTPNFDIAYSFGNKRLTAYAIDPRLLSFNYASGYVGEQEFLLPLTTFPDDLVAMYDSQIHKFSNSENFMKDLFKQKLIGIHGEQKGNELYQQTIDNSAKYFKNVFTPIKEQYPNQVKAFDQITFKDLKAIPKIIEPKTGETCTELITTFWK